MTLRDLGWLVLLGAIWGSSYVFLRVAAPVLGVFVLIDLRVWIAGSALLLYALALRRQPALRGHWCALFALGAINAAMPFTLIANSTVFLNASLAAIINATTPLFTALVAAFWLKEPLGWRKAAGLALGLLGVAVLVGWSPLGLDRWVLLGVAGSLGGALCYGIGGVYSRRRFRGFSPLDLSIGQQLAAGLLLLPLAVGTAHSQPLSWVVILSVLALALLCTAIAYLIYFDLIARVGPTNTLSVTFLVPIFATVWGLLFLGEPLRVSMVVGLVIIFAGVLLVTGVRLPFLLTLCLLAGCQPIHPTQEMQSVQTHQSMTHPLTYLALGDSYTIGHGVSQAERWPMQLVARLRKQGLLMADPQIIATTGWTTDELEEGITRAQPQGPFDLVTLLIGVNNQYRHRPSDEYRNEFRRLLDQALVLAGHHPQRVIVVSIPDWGVTPFARGRNAAEIAAEIDLFNAINRAEAKAAGVRYVDITPISRQAATDSSLLASDQLHPSGKMYTAWVELILPVALEGLRGERVRGVTG